MAASYDQWNESIYEVVFPELDSPQPVYIDLEGEVLEALGQAMDLAPDAVESSLCKVVADTLYRGDGPSMVFASHMNRLRRWVRGGRKGSPPFLALLATFCVAAEQMTADDGMAAHNYFGRLRSVLDWGRSDPSLDLAYRRVAERLWSEHNRWLVELDGQRGLPTAYALSHRYVGLPVSQALIRSTDHERLKLFFRQYGFAPGSDVPPADLVPVLSDWFASAHCPVSMSLQRLWKKGQARERIAQAAAVSLTSWDGSISEKGDDPTTRSSGVLALTLELAGFPRRRFGISALLYLSDPSVPRAATVLSATPSAQVDLVPDLPGALGLGRESALHAGDVLEGVLRVQDSRSEAVLERRPRRLVVFREDDLSRRWIEAPQVMLGDNVRLLVHESLLERLQDVLDTVARPGWEVAAPAPGQPEGWVVLTGVEVFSHPGGLIKPSSLDDLAPLVPLTSSQLKVAGGFALPGRIRGKWHSWSPPEVRAVSDVEAGFAVRVIDLHRFDDDTDEARETVLAEWSDDGTGVIVRSLAELELGDGDYRVELVPAGTKEPLSTTTVILRSSDTPDAYLWAHASGTGYSGGPGAVGLSTSDTETIANGLLVHQPQPFADSSTSVPSAPQWQVGRHGPKVVAPALRITVPDADSCIRTGRHREQIDTVQVDKVGRPHQAWTYGRCKGCGLVRRYPTRLPRASFGGRKKVEEPVAPAARDLASLDPVVATEERDWSTAFDALLHAGGGSWSQLERIALQLEPTSLFVDQFARTLEALGHVDIRRDLSTMQPVSWEVGPTVLAGTGSEYVFAGFWPNGLYTTASERIQDEGIGLAMAEDHDCPTQYFAQAATLPDRVSKALQDEDIAVVDLAWQDLAAVLPPLSQVLEGLPRQSASMSGEITRFDTRDASWQKVETLEEPGAFRVRRFATLDLVRSSTDVADGLVARSTVQLGKHLAALMDGRPLMAYDSANQRLVVPLGADLPGLYGRTAVAASGLPPSASRKDGLLWYEPVPPALAAHLYDLFSR